jgi:hypothetical protein
MPEDRFRLIFHVLQSEQSILSRADQKAYTLLSILGVFMVFFIAYYRLMVVNYFIVAMLTIYFAAAALAIYSLVRTIMPRFKKSTSVYDSEVLPDPTYFGGIRQYKSAEEYYKIMSSLQAEDERSLKFLSHQVYALAQINWDKALHLRWGMFFFFFAIGAELLMILSTFIMMGLQRLGS